MGFSSLREEVFELSKDKERPSDEKRREERDPLAKVLDLVPLLAVILQLIELLLRIWEMIR